MSQKHLEAVLKYRYNLTTQSPNSEAREYEASYFKNDQQRNAYFIENILIKSIENKRSAILAHYSKSKRQNPKLGNNHTKNKIAIKSYLLSEKRINFSIFESLNEYLKDISNYQKDKFHFAKEIFVQTAPWYFKRQKDVSYDSLIKNMLKTFNNKINKITCQKKNYLEFAIDYLSRCEEISMPDNHEFEKDICFYDKVIFNYKPTIDIPSSFWKLIEDTHHKIETSIKVDFSHIEEKINMIKKRLY